MRRIRWINLAAAGPSDPNLTIERCGQECPGARYPGTDEPGPPPTVVRNSSPATSGRVRLTVTWGVSAEVDPPTTAAPIARGSLVDCSSTAAAVGWVSPLPVESGQVAVPCRVDRRDVGEAGPSSCRVTSHPGGAVTITSPKQ